VEEHRYPKAVFFIIGNEFCERFSFFGLRGMWYDSAEVLLPWRLITVEYAVLVRYVASGLEVGWWDGKCWYVIPLAGSKLYCHFVSEKYHTGLSLGKYGQ